VDEPSTQLVASFQTEQGVRDFIKRVEDVVNVVLVEEENELYEMMNNTLYIVAVPNPDNYNTIEKPVLLTEDLAVAEEEYAQINGSKALFSTFSNTLVHEELYADDHKDDPIHPNEPKEVYGVFINNTLAFVMNKYIDALEIVQSKTEMTSIVKFDLNQCLCKWVEEGDTDSTKNE
jgi:hypothetical protein